MARKFALNVRNHLSYTIPPSKERKGESKNQPGKTEKLVSGEVGGLEGGEKNHRNFDWKAKQAPACCDRLLNKYLNLFQVNNSLPTPSTPGQSEKKIKGKGV